MALGTFIKETRAELKHVSWPTRSQAIAYTVIVIVISLCIAAYLGLLDYVFTIGLQFLINHF
jgi:preprotein translocase subunit SecE